MRIVVNALSARLGGGQTYLRNLLCHLPDWKNLEIFVFAPDELDLPSHACIRRVKLNWPTENPLLRTVWEKLFLPVFLRKEQVDVLFCPGGLVATPVPRNCRVVTMFRNMIPFDPRVRRCIPWGRQRLRNWILKRVMLKSMAHADLTIFISDYARSVIESLVSIPNPVTIPHGIGDDFRTHDCPPARPASLLDEEYLLYVSRFDVYKHHYEVVSAYAILPESLRTRFVLMLAGETNLPETDRVNNLIEQLGIRERVRMVGAIPYHELPAVYHHATLVLFASSCENCPNILLEALASGRPVLSSNIMPMPEFGGDAVEYFSPFDSNHLAQVMMKVLEDEGYAGRLAIAAAEQSARFDWARTAKMTWSSILRLVENNNR